MTDQPQINSREFGKALLKWFRKHRRRLPWREEPSLYKTVVSEFMLQQTQVATVLPYFERWMNELPDFDALARAEESRVLKLWEGLGYYSRARNLHALACELVALPDIPRSAEEWQQFKGVGAYASAAIASIAQNVPVAVCDGNVVRILSRLHSIETEFKDGSSAMKQLQPLAAELLNTGAPGEHNEAMMELGATVCTKAQPQCLLCPVRSFCRAGQEGIAASLPKFKPKQRNRVTVDRALVIREGKVLLEQLGSEEKRLAGQYELPRVERLGLSVKRLKPFVVKKRGIANDAIEERIYRFNAEECGLSSRSESLGWYDVEELSQLTLSGPHRRWLTDWLAH